MILTFKLDLYLLVILNLKVTGDRSRKRWKKFIFFGLCTLQYDV